MDLVPAGLRRLPHRGRPSWGNYVCPGESQAGNSGDPLVPAYRALAADIDACVVRPIWYPSRWRQGQEFAFATGERQTIRRDDSSGDPRPEFALKVQEDLARRLFYLRLAVASGA